MAWLLLINFFSSPFIMTGLVKRLYSEIANSTVASYHLSKAITLEINSFCLRSNMGSMLPVIIL